MKKKIILIVLAILIAVGGGIGAYFIKEAHRGPAQIEETEAKYKTTVKEAPTDGSNPEQYSVLDNLAFAMWTIENAKEFKTTTTGKSEASVATIQIYNTRLVKDHKALVSTVSSGMISSGKQKYFLDNKVLLRDADHIDGFNTTWKTAQPECISNSAYIKRYGWLPFQCTGYIICKETILEASELIVNEDGTYTIRLSLNPNDDYAPFWYRREVLTNANSSMVPKFNSIKIDYKMDSTWHILEAKIKEEYKVKAMGIEAVSKTDCTEVFDYSPVEFENGDTDFFKQYEILEPADGSEDTPKEDDVLTMITSSLQNADGTDKNLKLTLTWNDTTRIGLVRLNISDLKNVKVAVQLEDLYVSYQDNIYLSLGGLKIKATPDDIQKILASFKGDTSSTEGLDTSAIISDLNSAEVTKNADGTDIEVYADLHIFDISLPLYFHFFKGETYQLITAHTDLELEGNKIGVILEQTTEQVEEIDTTEFIEVSDLSFIVDEVVELLDQKQATLDFTATYKDLTISVNGKTDFRQSLLLDCLVRVQYSSLDETIRILYGNDIIYLEYGSIHLKLNKDDAEKIIEKYTDISLSIPDIDINNIINTILSIDYDALLKDVVSSDTDISLTLGLSSFMERMKDFQLQIKKEEGLNVAVIYDNLMADIQCKAGIDTPIEIIDEGYENLGYLDYIIEDVLALYHSKKMTLVVNGEKEDLSLSGQIKVDFTDKMKLSATIELGYKDITLPLELSYFNTYKIQDVEYSNVIFVHFESLYGYLTMEDIEKYLPQKEDSEWNLDTILNMIFSLDFEQIIQSLKLEEDHTILDLNLSTYADSLKKWIDTTKPFRIEITNRENGLAVSLKELFDLNMEILASYDGTIEVETEKYIHLSEFADDIAWVAEGIGKNSYRISLDGMISLGKEDMVLSLNDSKIDLILADGIYHVQGYICATVSNMVLEVYIQLVEKDLYVSIGGLTIRLNVAELESFIQQICKKFEWDMPNITLSSNGLENILQRMEFTNENSIGFDMSGLLKNLSKLTILFAQIEERMEIQVSDSQSIDLKLSISKTQETEYKEAPMKYITQNDILTLCGYVKEILDSVQKKEFSIEIGKEQNPLQIIQNKELKYKIYGMIQLDYTDKENISLGLVLNVLEYKGKNLVSNHNLNLIIRDHMVYGIYGNSTDLNNVLKVKTGLDNILGILATLEKVSGLNLEEYIPLEKYLNPELNYVDFTSLRQLIQSFIEDKNPIESQEELHISDLIHSVTVLNEEYIIQLDMHHFISAVPENEMVTIRIGKTDSELSLTLDKLYTAYESMDKYNAIENLSVSLGAVSGVEAPSDLEGYYDINELGDLVDGIVTTATFRDFHIAGTIQLEAISILKVDIPIDLYVEVDSSGKPIVFAHMDMQNIGSLYTLIVSKKDIYILYQDGYVYINRVDSKSKNSKRICITLDTFLSDIMYYLLDFSMGLPDSILKLINTGEKKDTSIDASKVITAYSYSEDLSLSSKDFTFGLNMKELTGNADLGELKAKVRLTPVVVKEENDLIYDAYALTSVLDFSFKMVNVITLSCKELKLSNLEQRNMHTYFTDIMINNMDFSEYVASYKKDNFTIQGMDMPMDTIYDASGTATGKCEHTVFFHMGEGTDLDKNNFETISIRLEAGSTFSIPAPSSEYRLYNGRQYHFVGWFKDSEGITEFKEEDAVIQNKNTHVYAKWEEMYQFTIIDSQGMGLKEVLLVGENTSTYTIEQNQTEFLGFYNALTDECITTDFTLPSMVMKNQDLTVYTKWKNMAYLVVEDQKFSLADEENTDTILGLTHEKYQILVDGRYYTYPVEYITSKFLYSEYRDIMEVIEEGDCTIRYIYLEPYIAYREGYRTITLDYDSYVFYNEKNNPLYIEIAMKDSDVLQVKELPFGVNGEYEINAWIEQDKTYSPLAEGSIASNTISALITLRKELFTIQDTTITGISSEWKGNILILPKYTVEGKEITVIGANAFAENTQIQTVIINEGVLEIQTNAFKNCKSLNQGVYIPYTVTKIEKDAFYFDDGNMLTSEKEYAEKMKIYFVTDTHSLGFDYSQSLYGYKTGLFKAEYHYYVQDSALKDCIQELNSTIFDVIKNII